MFATWRRRLAFAAVVLAIAAGGYFVLRPQPVPADFETVARGDVVVTVNGEGVTRIADLFVVSSPLAGRAMRSLLEVGDAVTAGKTVVAAIRPTPPDFLNARDRRVAEARVRAAEAAERLAAAELARVGAELEFARNDLDRAEQLSKTNTVSVRELDRARLLVATKEAELASAKANLAVRGEELETARAVLIEPESGLPDAKPGGECCVLIYAPQSGQVLNILHKSESVVAAGAPLMEIGDPTNLELVVDLLSADAVRVKVGNRATIARWGGEKDLNAVVRRIEPTGFTKVSSLGIEEQRVRVILDFTDPPIARAALGHDFRVFARIEISRAVNVVRVPLSALFRVGNDWAAFVVEQGRAARKTVQLGLRNTRHAEIRSGLAQGDTVIVHPGDRIADGVEVEPRAP
ncbi:RND efflux system, membrane fusion protein [hydrothermal vent metagenome]|uniref:RND efflux system, membrane fusion protein n=1 Tax=hydrothermal vent metagenome TaxID=652676 RepID=A0A3B0TDK6_9ZZZZ